MTDRLPDKLESNARVEIRTDGTVVGTRRIVDLISGTDMTVSGVDDGGLDDKVTVTFDATGGGGGGGWGAWIDWPNPRVGDFEFDLGSVGLVEASFDGTVTRYGQYRVRGTGESGECQFRAMVTNLGSGGVTPPSGLSLAANAVVFELPLPALESVLPEADYFTILGTGNPIPVQPMDGAAQVNAADANDFIALDGLTNPMWADQPNVADSQYADWTDDDKAAFRRCAVPIASDYYQSRWKWDGTPDAVNGALGAVKSIWSWSGAYPADVTADVSG